MFVLQNPNGLNDRRVRSGARVRASRIRPIFELEVPSQVSLRRTVHRRNYLASFKRNRNLSAPDVRQALGLALARLVNTFNESQS